MPTSAERPFEPEKRDKVQTRVQWGVSSMDQNDEGKVQLVRLAVRVTIGIIFLFAGIQHVVGIEGYTGLFTTIGIPMPETMAPFVAWLELIGGIALILGALTKIFAPLLAVVMVVAMIAFKIPNAYGTFSETAREVTYWGFVGAIRLEFLLMLLCIALFILGPGKFAVDRFLFAKKSDGESGSPAS